MTITITPVPDLILRPRSEIVDALHTFCREAVGMGAGESVDSEGYALDISWDNTFYYVRRYKPDEFDRIETTDPLTGKTVRTNGDNVQQGETEEEAALSEALQAWSSIPVEQNGDTTTGGTALFEITTVNDLYYEVWEGLGDSRVDDELIDSGTASPYLGVITIPVSLTTETNFYTVHVVDDVEGKTGWNGQTANPP